MVKVSTAIPFGKITITALLSATILSSPVMAQEADDAAAEAYGQLLQQIADMKMSIAHQEVYIATQQGQIDSLQEQISETQGLIDSVGPMLREMTDAISGEIDSDLPFNAEERFNRLGALEEIVGDNEARAADKWRRALDIYNAEVNYGQTIEAYAGDHPSEPGTRLAACQDDYASSRCAMTDAQIKKIEDAGRTVDELRGELKDGSYLRYGRLAFVYAQEDGSEVLRYNPDTKAWDKVTGGRALEIRRAVKIAKGEAAPGVVEAPILIAN